MKKIIILFLSLSLMLICNDPDMKALITYSINNENIIGYEEYENLSFYSNISKYENLKWDNYLGLIKIKNIDKSNNGIEIVIYENYKVAYSKGSLYKEFFLTDKEKKIFEGKYNGLITELKKNYNPEKKALFDKVTPFSINRIVEIIKLENYAYLTFIPGEYSMNKIFEKEAQKTNIEYKNIKEFVDFLKLVIARREEGYLKF